jgi:hypothetical protein
MHYEFPAKSFEEVQMNIASLALMCVWAASLSPVQTQDMGQGVFYSDVGDVVMAVDAVVANRKLDKPYVMFMLYMGTSGNSSIKIKREDVTMIYNGQEFKMPTVKELNASYNGGQNDWTLYERSGKESLILSRMRYWRYQTGTDFFPLLSRNIMAVGEGSMAGDLGFRTRLYFKNPGFKKGDEIVIQVKDQSNPELSGSCAVKFE